MHHLNELDEPVTKEVRTGHVTDERHSACYECNLAEFLVSTLAIR